MLEKDRPNRAVTSIFQAFGGRLRTLSGDAVHMAEGAGHHRFEWRVLSVLIPLVAGAAVFDGLWWIGGPWLAWCGVLPTLLVVLHVVAYVLGGNDATAQWRRWALLLTLWAAFQWFMVPDCEVAWAMWLWFAMLLANAAGAMVLIWRALMTADIVCTAAVRWLIAVVIHVPAGFGVWHYGWRGGVAVMLAAAAFWCCGTFLPNARIFGPIARRVHGKDVLITIDDGPDPEDTPALLDLLDRHGRKAVFFVIGEKVRRFPELAREIVRRGHELGNHTMTHPVGFFWGYGPTRTRREIEGCQRAIEEVTGVKVRFFRAPAGHRNWFTHPVLKELGLELVGWRKRAFDTVRSDVGGIVRDLTGGVKEGDILLLHEATPTAEGVMEGVLTILSDRFPSNPKGSNSMEPNDTVPDSTSTSPTSNDRVAVEDGRRGFQPTD
ncbi:polysaccharide deacetylase family protein [Luteolibacter arcticus]|uniref:Polysaccharide deacetylase family protein n=1 Tax=Luteolibacter arcticus TaxID=1581411 RepID=A0ABT3GR54_9BACT|nr:polysaccharide deacetylase family protein [Luteolibacter arcticus]MCW1925961.1 polysaccharide deacetylase family protein [Luteolibacter arcticus]